MPAAATDIVMRSVDRSLLSLLGGAGKNRKNRKNRKEQVSRLTGGKLPIEFNQLGAIVGGNERWNAIFTAVPFGQDIRADTAWRHRGGGAEIWADIPTSCARFWPQRRQAGSPKRSTAPTTSRARECASSALAPR
jgi:hypothetical protein